MGKCYPGNLSITDRRRLSTSTSGEIESQIVLWLDPQHLTGAAENTVIGDVECAIFPDGHAARGEQALAICREALGEVHPATVNNLINLIILSLLLQDQQAAFQYWNQVMSVTQDLPETHASKKIVMDFLRQIRPEEEGNPET